MNSNIINTPFEKSKIVSFAFSVMKNIVTPSAVFRFAVKIICCIAVGSASIFCCLLKSIGISL